MRLTQVPRLLLWGLLAFPALAQEEPPLPAEPSPGNPVREVLPASPAPFRSGESLRFLIRYGLIHAGFAWLEVPGTMDWNGRPSWHLVARAESNGFFDHFYKVRIRIESVWDQETHASHRYTENRQEGSRTTANAIDYDLDEGKATYQDGASYPIPALIQDALSAFYCTRFHALPVGGSFFFDYHASRTTQRLEVKVLGRETVKTPAGRFSCVMIEPMLKAGGIFAHRGRLVIWVTDDARRIPVLMKSKVAIGSISVVLQELREGS